MIILFNINNKEVLSQVDNERIMYVFNLAVSMNKENNEKGEHNFIGMTFAPDDFWKMEIAERGAYLDRLKRLGVDVLMDEGWKAKKKEDGTWDLRSFKIMLGIDMAR